jgi:hypothetical protein
MEGGNRAEVEAEVESKEETCFGLLTTSVLSSPSPNLMSSASLLLGNNIHIAFCSMNLAAFMNFEIGPGSLTDGTILLGNPI